MGNDIHILSLFLCEGNQLYEPFNIKHLASQLTMYYLK